MGRRYAAICDYLGYEWVGQDLSDNWPDPESISHAIIATPTEGHIRDIISICNFIGDDLDSIPILCEKPIRTSELKYHLETRLSDCERANLCMVNNYAHIPQIRQDAMRSWRSMDTIYSFYNTGNDGVYWDCIQLIHLAQRAIKINTDEPMWFCKINGVPINRSQVDRGYVDMIKDFLGPQLNMWGYEDIIAAHKKVEAFAKTNSLFCEHVPQLVEHA
jgi:hypothetical protein